MDAMSPKSLKVVLGKGGWFVRKPHLFQDDVRPCASLSSVSSNFLLHLVASAPVSSIQRSIYPTLLLVSHKLTSQSQREHFSSSDFCRLGLVATAGKWPEKPFRGGTLQFAGKVRLGP